MKRTPLARKTPMRPVRSKPRPGRLKGAALAELRRDCWYRDGGVCQECLRVTDPDLPSIADRSYHMAHIKAKRIGGDSLENVRTLCGECHRDEHNGTKGGKMQHREVMKGEKQ